MLSCHWSLVVWATHGIFSPPLLSTARYLSCIPFWCSSFWQLTCTGVTVGSGSVCLQWPSELETQFIRIPHSLLHSCSEDSYWRLSSHVTTILNLQSNANERRFTFVFCLQFVKCSPNFCSMTSSAVLKPYFWLVLLSVCSLPSMMIYDTEWPPLDLTINLQFWVKVVFKHTSS